MQQGQSAEIHDCMGTPEKSCNSETISPIMAPFHKKKNPLYIAKHLIIDRSRVHNSLDFHWSVLGFLLTNRSLDCVKAQRCEI